MLSVSSIDSKCECPDPCPCTCECNPCRCGCRCEVPCPCLDDHSDKVRILQKKEKCITNITRSKYERTDQSTRQWWNRQFTALEEKKAMPFYKRRNHLQKVFSEETLKDVIKAGCEIHSDWGLDLEKEKVKSVVEPTSESKLNPKRPFDKYEEYKEPEKEYTNPYLNFFRKSEKKAQIWRPRPKPPIERQPLIKKAKLLEEKLATEFDEWFSNVGSKVKSEIDKDVILSIFEIGMSYPVMTSINVQTSELGAVPAHTANFVGCPSKGESESVRREIERDIKAGLLKPKLVAFGKNLPEDLRRQPFTENLKAKWFEYPMRHNDIGTMATVFRGITELQTTRAFINYILYLPYVTPPLYLKGKGLMKVNLPYDSRLDEINFDYLEAEIGMETEEMKKDKYEDYYF